MQTLTTMRIGARFVILNAEIRTAKTVLTQIDPFLTLSKRGNPHHY